MSLAGPTSRAPRRRHFGRRLGVALIVLAAVALAGLSGAMALRESAPFLLRAQSLGGRVAVMEAAASDGSPVSAFESHFARSARLDLCLDTLVEIVSAAGFPPATEDGIVRGCLAIAEATAARSPLESNVWFLAGTLAARLGDLDQAVRYLKTSYETGPNEQWIAERRALFVYALRARLGVDMEQLLDQDFALLLRTGRGLDVLATRYINDPGMRDRLITIAETLDPEDQARFLDRIEDQIEARP